MTTPSSLHLQPDWFEGLRCDYLIIANSLIFLRREKSKVWLRFVHDGHSINTYIVPCDDGTLAVDNVNFRVERLTEVRAHL